MNNKLKAKSLYSNKLKSSNPTTRRDFLKNFRYRGKQFTDMGLDRKGK